MRPNAPLFEPALVVAMSTAKTFDDQSLNESLLKALVKEKEEHRATRAILEKAQAQITFLSDETKTLNAAKRMLEAIVKNKNKTNSEDSEPRVLIRTAQEQTQAVKAFLAKGSTINNAHKSILYDVLAKQRETYETRGYPEGSSESEAESISQKQKHNNQRTNVQNEKLFDLSAVSPITQKGSEFTAQERKIFRHFLDDAEPAYENLQKSSPKAREKGESEDNALIEVTPPPHKLSIPKASKKPTVAEAVETCHQALKSVINSQSKVKMGQAVDNLEKPPTLLLPASFLSKYRPAPKIKPVVETPVEIAPVPIEPAPEKRPQIHKVDLTSPVKTKNAIIHAPPPMTPRTAPKDPKTRMEEYLKITPDVSAKVLPVLDTSIKWAMGSLVPVFNDEEEKRWSQRNTVNTGSYFWQHTVRFLPNPTEKNLYRTVMIDYIPPGATYQDVLAHLRTGALESIQMFPPLRGCTDYLTARVVFTYELPAVSVIMQFEKRLREGNPMRIRGEHVRIWQVLQPTYPANKQLEADIFLHGYTRILLLEHVEDSGVLPKLHEKLAPEIEEGSVIKINRTEDGVPMIEFTNVAAAAGAMRRFQTDREFKGCVFDFDKDYCEDAYEE